MSRRTVLTAVIALSAFGLTAGLTASLNVAADDLGAATETVAACQPAATPIVLSYGVAAGAVNEVVEVTLDDVAAACNGQTATVTLLDVNGDALDSIEVASLTADGTTPVVLDMTTEATLADAAAVTDVSVVITGA